MAAPHRLALGVNIRRLRRALRWTQEVLAERADINWTHLQEIESGKTNPGYDVLHRICGALGCDWNTMMPDASESKGAPVPMGAEPIPA